MMKATAATATATATATTAIKTTTMLRLNLLRRSLRTQRNGFDRVPFGSSEPKRAVSISRRGARSVTA